MRQRADIAAPEQRSRERTRTHRRALTLGTAGVLLALNASCGGSASTRTAQSAGTTTAPASAGARPIESALEEAVENHPDWWKTGFGACADPSGWNAFVQNGALNGRDPLEEMKAYVLRSSSIQPASAKNDAAMAAVVGCAYARGLPIPGIGG